MSDSNFKSNIVNIYAAKGKKWLDELPKIVADTASRLGLCKLSPVSNLTYNYVLSGFQGDTAIILKLGLDNNSLFKEAFALRCFSGFGAVNIFIEEKGLLLLERAIPGVSLKTYFPEKDIDAIEIACDVMKRLHQAIIPSNHNFFHIKDWLSVLDKPQDIKTEYLQKARILRDKLLATSSSDVLLHGDLHHDNILQNNKDWLVIDPKAVIGESAYEVASFIHNPIPTLLEHEDVFHVIQDRIARFAENLKISPDRIVNWCFVKAVLSWVWAVEDKCDIDYWLHMTKILDEIAIS